MTALASAMLLAFTGGQAVAQAGLPGTQADATPLPIWNSANGKLEAVLWIDTHAIDAAAPRPALGSRWNTPDLSAQFSVRGEPRFGLLCGGQQGFQGLGDNCLVTELGRPAPLASTETGFLAQASARAGRTEWSGFARQQRAGLAGLGPTSATALLMPELAPVAGLAGATVEQNDLGIVGEIKLGQQGWINIGGSVARARLLPATSLLPGTVAPRWNSQTLSVGGGFGALGGEVIGRVVRVPGERESYGTLGLGVTWRTPWSGRLTVGAQNLMSTGENPLSPRDAKPAHDVRSEGRVPYVRYQQDL